MADTRIFNVEQLLNYTAEDRELAAEVVQVYLTDTPRQLAAFTTALTARDAKTAERVAHSIKGASATVGAEALRHKALECEQLSRAGDFAALEPMIPELAGLFAALREEMARAGFIGS